MEKRKHPVSRSTVSIIKIAGMEQEAIRRGTKCLIDSLGGIEGIIPARTKSVLIKPNLMTGKPCTTGITVHPYLIETLATALKDRGVKVTVGEGAGWDGEIEENGQGNRNRQLSAEVSGKNPLCFGLTAAQRFLPGIGPARFERRLQGNHGEYKRGGDRDF